VLHHLIRGRTNAEIATNLFLAETTVKTPVASVLRKLGLSDRVQVIIYGYEHGLIQPGQQDRRYAVRFHLKRVDVPVDTSLRR
jgi:hypothetical protein